MRLDVEICVASQRIGFARSHCATRHSENRQNRAVPGQALDTVVTAETPEGILLELRPAGLSPRFFAFLIDWLIRVAVIYALMMVVGIAGDDRHRGCRDHIFWFLLEWFYPVVFELSRSGATPGKRVFGLRVVMDNGLPITPGASVTRNLLRVADFLPFLFGFAIVSMLLRKDCKRLGDIAAATLVVHDTRAAPKIELNEVEPLAPARPLNPRIRPPSSRWRRAHPRSRASGSTSSRRSPRRFRATTGVPGPSHAPRARGCDVLLGRRA